MGRGRKVKPEEGTPGGAEMVPSVLERILDSESPLW